MRRLTKIMIISIIIVLIGTIVLPVIVDISKVFNMNSKSIFAFLSQVTDSMIVEASDDYGYNGNLYIIADKDHNWQYRI